MSDNKLKGWTFRGWIPDGTDCNACLNATIHLQEIIDIEESPVDGVINAHTFSCGFYRGADWSLFKTTRAFRLKMIEATGGRDSSRMFSAKEVIDMVRTALAEIEAQSLPKGK